MVLKIKKATFLIVIVLFTSAITSCTNTAQQVELEKEIFNRARAVDDAPVAINAAYRIVLLDKEQTNYYDSIAQIYFEVQNFKGAKTVALNVSKERETKQIANIIAYSDFNTGNYTDASLYIQDLIKLDPENKIKYLYDLGICAYNMNNYTTTLDYMTQVMNHPASKMTKKSIAMGNQQYETYYYILALNTIGYTYMVEEKYENAEQAFQKLLEIEPNFEVAKNNYALLQEIKASNSGN